MVFILQKFPFQKVPYLGKLFEEGKFLEQLFSCDLCLGVWVYAVLAFIYHMDFIYDLFNVYIIVLNELITGMIASFTMHLISVGWSTKFQIVEIN